MPVTIHTIYNQVFKIWRRRRFELFLRLMKPKFTDVLLDVGGSPWFWTGHSPCVKEIDVLNIYEFTFKPQDSGGHSIRTVVGDGCHLSMTDNTYDIVFSNSVIEHVGSWERQRQFASEVRRVGKALWVQTPAYECPIEPHYMAPFVHYLPLAIRKATVRWCTIWGWIERPSADQVKSMVETTRLLRKAEMRQLFPDCDIITEYLLWIIPKSYIAVRPPHSAEVS
jgi:Methyltransferase domain